MVRAKGITKETPEWRRKDSGVNVGAEYTPDEVEFIDAISRWQDRHPGKRPTCCDVLQVAKALGYRKSG